MSETPTVKKRNRISLCQITKIAVFLLILILLFHFFTLLYDRPVTTSVAEFRNEPEDTIDVVSIGASTVYTFFDPMEIWEKYGITSYAYAIPGATGDDTIFSLEDVLKKQKPKLLILEVRGFLGSRSGGIDKNFYRFLKNYTNPFKRWEIIRHFCKTRGIRFSSSQMQYYLTLLMNHENYWNLFRVTNWKKALLGSNTIIQKKPNLFKGYYVNSNVRPQVDIPYDSKTKSPLHQGEETALRELLDYCKKKDQRVLLVASPFIYSDEDAAQLNAIGDVADEYEVPYINTNNQLETLGINWSTDFYDRHHANLIGATKYTDFISAYIVEHYDLPDHRGDSNYSGWEKTDEAYRAYRKKSFEKLKTHIEEIHNP